jgi:hypothetical protein
MPRAFGDDERVAAECDRDVVMPAGESTPSVVVESEFTFEVFVGAAGTPAFGRIARSQIDLRQTLSLARSGIHRGARIDHH